jgi:thioredoxin reductase (NADPH)
MFTTEVENFPGYPDGVTGPEMMNQMRDQALKFGTRVMTDKGPETTVGQSDGYDIVHHWQNVESVDLRRGAPFRITSDQGETLDAQTIIIATGARANYLGLPSEQAFMNRGVSACAVCDGALPRFRNKPLVVVGGGDSAIEEASYLTKFASTVYLIHRRAELRASKIMQQRAFDNPKIEILWNSAIKEIQGTDAGGVTQVLLSSTTGQADRTIDATGVFLAIGHTPNTDFLAGQLELNEKGYIKLTQPPRTYTSIEGVFAAGDVADDYYRQAITAAGTGCAAALDAERYLAAKGVH